MNVPSVAASRRIWSVPDAIWRGRWGIAVVVTLGMLAGAPVAESAVRVKTDRGSGVRFLLEGKRLTVSILDRRNHQVEPPVIEQVSGKRVRVACGTRFQYSQGVIVKTRRRWPKGETAAQFRFGRNVSHRARWCVIEAGESARDVAAISFIRREPARLLARGRTDRGERWRLVGWRGSRLQPCMHLAHGDGAFTICLDDPAEREAKLETVLNVLGCRRPRQRFLMGVAPRSTATVDVVLDDAVVSGRVLPRPSGSRVRAKYVLAVLPGDAKIRRVVARDSEGLVVARERGNAKRLMVC
ncbi:MAG: hypothetical protein WD399_01625 [Thermoleophilaceae bacterium]